jgi:DNA-binding NtrC family response regulator
VKPARRKKTQSQPSLQAPRPRILIVDDETAILRALSRELEAEFEIATARSGSEAFEAVDGKSVDVLLCDVNLVGESGLDVAAKLAERDRRLAGRIVYMTGGTLSERARAEAERNPARFVAKPFDLPALVRLLKGVASDTQ